MPRDLRERRGGGAVKAAGETPERPRRLGREGRGLVAHAGHEASQDDDRYTGVSAPRE